MRRYRRGVRFAEDFESVYDRETGTIQRNMGLVADNLQKIKRLLNETQGCMKRVQQAGLADGGVEAKSSAKMYSQLEDGVKKLFKQIDEESRWYLFEMIKKM